MNTRICYLYRDSDNYKVHNMCVIHGELTDSFESCNQEADTFLTAEQLTANFQACKNNWRDDLAPNGMEGPTL